MTPVTSGYEAVGKTVHIVNPNPNADAEWWGFAVAFSDQPTLLVEVADGSRMMLPAAWITEVLPTPSNSVEDADA